ncbi:MAG: hypothetical protein PsegKO_03890 [Pseudohongiellaceae bacterium]
MQGQDYAQAHDKNEFFEQFHEFISQLFTCSRAGLTPEDVCSEPATAVSERYQVLKNRTE